MTSPSANSAVDAPASAGTRARIAGVPVSRDKVCYLFAGWFSGAMDWVGQATGQTWKTHSEETRCAAEGHAHCVFTVTPIAH